MATIIKLKSLLTGKTSYRAQIRVKGRSESKTFPVKAEAKEWAASSETAIREGKHFPHAAAQRVTFDTLAKSYVENALGDMGGAKSKQGKTRIQQVTWWSDHFNGKSVAEITSDAIKLGRNACAAETFARGKERRNKKTGEVVQPKQYKRSAATVNRYVAALSAVFTYATNEHVPKLLTVNPVRGVGRKTEPKGRIRFLSDDERARLLDACAKSAWPALHTLVLLAITSGARRTEMTSLEWDNVNVDEGRATVHETKNGESRTLTIRGEALKAIKALASERNAKPKNERSKYVFPSPSGLDDAVEFFDSYWHAALKTAGIDYKKKAGNEGFRFHDLRHTCASYLAAQKCSLLEIAHVLGHKTLAMVQRYAHLTKDHSASVIDQMVKAKGL